MSSVCERWNRSPLRVVLDVCRDLALWSRSCWWAFALSACDTGEVREPRSSTIRRSPSPPAKPVLLGFVETSALLEEREILLNPLPGSVDVMSNDAFSRRLEQRLSRHPSWEVLSVHLGEVDLVNPHFNRYNEPMYVVEITGPRTGNCLDLYDAIDGEYTLGACFYPTRP